MRGLTLILGCLVAAIALCWATADGKDTKSKFAVQEHSVWMDFDQGWMAIVDHPRFYSKDPHVQYRTKENQSGAAPNIAVQVDSESGRVLIQVKRGTQFDMTWVD